MQGNKIFGEITSNVWSPRYSIHLCFASCNIELLEDSNTTYVETSNRKVGVEITNLPFDFKSIGFSE